MTTPDVDKILAIAFDMLSVPYGERAELRDHIVSELEKSNNPTDEILLAGLRDDCYRLAKLHAEKANVSLGEFESGMKGTLQHLRDWVDQNPVAYEPHRAFISVRPVLHIIQDVEEVEVNQASQWQSGTCLTTPCRPSDQPVCVANAISLYFLLSESGELYVWRAVVDEYPYVFTSYDIREALISLRTTLRYFPEK